MNMKYGCIGEKLAHSYSKEIHSKIAPYEYELCEVSREGFAEFMERCDFIAINVTIPYKRDVIPYLSYIDEGAEKIGAVNTIVNRGGKLCGYNTDFYGMSALIRRLGVDICGKKAAVLGTGGTSRTARAVLSSMGASEILTVSRTPHGEEIGYEELCSEHSDLDFIVNTTPCGMYPNPDGRLIDMACFSSLKGVVDAIYNPLRTNLILDAQERGIPASGGLYMLVAQAVRAAEIFMDKDLDTVAVTERIYAEMMAEKQDIVLIGMPGCGKSTVGRALSEKLGKEYLDLDEEIVRSDGREISRIFAEDGEAAFRDAETRVIRERARFLTGAVISTGGGAVLRTDNVRMLKQNGRIYFLNRDIEKIVPTKDRPLSSDADMLRKRFRERYGIYKSVCDREIITDECVENTVRSIVEDFGKQ